MKKKPLNCCMMSLCNFESSFVKLFPLHVCNKRRFFSLFQNHKSTSRCCKRRIGWKKRSRLWEIVAPKNRLPAHIVLVPVAIWSPNFVTVSHWRKLLKMQILNRSMGWLGCTMHAGRSAQRKRKPRLERSGQGLGAKLFALKSK